VVVLLNWSVDTPIRSVLPAVPARYRDGVLFVVLAALFGGSFVAIKSGLRELPPLLFASLRFDVAALVLLGYVASTRPRSAWLPRTRDDLAWVGVAALFLVGLSNGLLFAGQGATTAAAASVLYGLNPILAPVFAWWLLGDRLSGVGALGIGVALAGVVLIVQPSPSTFTDANAAGGILILGAAASAALGSVLLQRVSPGMETTPLTAWAMAAGALALHAASVAAGESLAGLVDVGPATVASLLAVAIPSTAVAYVIYFGLIDRVGPVRANLVAYTVPLFAAVLGWAVLGTAVSVWTVAGFLVVVVGFAVIERETIREELRRVRSRRGETDAPTATPPCDD
jgi:drug/metabolite transporter (DMT)-like permease